MVRRQWALRSDQAEAGMGQDVQEPRPGTPGSPGAGGRPDTPTPQAPRRQGPVRERAQDQAPGREETRDREAESAPVISVGFFIAGVVLLVGLVLLGTDLFGDPDYSRSMDIPINRYWGLVMIVVGAVTGGLSWWSLARQGRRPTLPGR
jgi:hypothetical protein